MKKLYAPPSVEKISFRYRDQVVAASGSPVANSDTDVGNSAGDRANQVVDNLLNGAGISSCDQMGDWVGSWFG